MSVVAWSKFRSGPFCPLRIAPNYPFVATETTACGDVFVGFIDIFPAQPSAIPPKIVLRLHMLYFLARSRHLALHQSPIGEGTTRAVSRYNSRETPFAALMEDGAVRPVSSRRELAVD